MKKSTAAPAAVLPAGGWVRYLAEADLLPTAPGQTEAARAIAAGRVLAGLVGRAVPVTADGRACTAVLRSVAGRARRTLYYFELHAGRLGSQGADNVRDDPPPPGGDLEVPPPGGAPGNHEAW